jgi:hypothetical protein
MSLSFPLSQTFGDALEREQNSAERGRVPLAAVFLLFLSVDLLTFGFSAAAFACWGCSALR